MIYAQDSDFTLYLGDCLEVLKTLDEGSVHCCVTSPPYWGLRNYGIDGQIGLEQTPNEYVDRMVEVFREVRRVLRDDGTLWLNLGDTHKAKQLVGMPWRVAFALQADGWWLRSDIIWSKPNPMPESVKDRPTKSHEYVFLLTKSPRYFFDQEAVREPPASYDRKGGSAAWTADSGHTNGVGSSSFHQMNPAGRNIRSVWKITPQPYKEAHFATFPLELPRRCIKAGCPEGGVVLDPFMGAGTTSEVARGLNRRSVGVELNPDYCALISKRLAQQRLLA